MPASRTSTRTLTRRRKTPTSSSRYHFHQRKLEARGSGFRAKGGFASASHMCLAGICKSCRLPRHARAASHALECGPLTARLRPPQVLPTQLIPDEKEGKVLRVRFIQKEGVNLFNPVYLFDEGSTISWIPCGRKLTCSFPGIK